MKKTVLALGSALMLFATNLQAQEQPLSFGIKAGGSYSWLKGLSEKKFSADEKEREREISPRFFATGGLQVGYAFHENVGLGLEVLYAGLGAKTSEKSAETGGADKASQNGNDAKKTTGEKTTGDGNDRKSFSIYSHNLVVPVTVRFFPMGCDPEEGILNIHLGVQGNFALPVDVQNEGQADSSFNKDYIKPFTLDAIGGIGYEFPGIGLTIEGRYNFGFMDIFKDDQGTKNYKETRRFKDKEFCNQSVTVSLGFDFAHLLMD